MTKKIIEILKEKDFTVSVELVPPRNGTDPENIFKNVAQLKDMIDFVSVTKGAGGSLRGGTLPVSYFTQEKFGINAIAHFVCREHTKQEIENDLIDLHYFNIKNILALRGDPPAGAKEEWNGDYEYAYILVKQINDLNNGRYLARLPEEGQFRTGIKTDFCILAAGHPEEPIEKEIEHIKQKINSGAEVIITQMIFSFEEYVKYVKSLKKAGIDIPVLAGLRPLKTIQQAESAENFFHIPIPASLKKGIAKKGKEFCIEYFTDFIYKLRKFKAPGAHFFILNDVDIVKELLRKQFTD